MSNRTVIVSISDLTRAREWTVYRVTTASSEYHLGMHKPDGQRWCAVLRGESASAGQHIAAEDSAPLIGSRPLFEVPVEDWIGQTLSVGTATTSPVKFVERETNRAIVESVTQTDRIARNPRTEPARAQPEVEHVTPPYPLNCVEYLEIAADILRATSRRTSLLEDLREHPRLLQRFQLSLANCLVLLEQLRFQHQS